MSTLKLFDASIPRQLCTKVASFVLCGITLVWVLMLVPRGPEHVGTFNVILSYKYLRNNFVHFVGLVSWIITTLSLTSTLDMCDWLTPRSSALAQGRDTVPIAEETGWAPWPVWTVRKISPFAMIRPASSQSLYQMGYPGRRWRLMPSG